MNDNLTTAILSARSTALVAIVALVLNNKGFDDIGKRIDDFGRRPDKVEHQFEVMQGDLKEF